MVSASAPVWAVPGETLRTGIAVGWFSSGTGQDVFQVSKGATCFTLLVWSRPLRESRTGTTPLPSSQPRTPIPEQHPRRDALETTVQVDPGLRIRAARMGERTAGDTGLCSLGNWCGWN